MNEYDVMTRDTWTCWCV